MSAPDAGPDNNPVPPRRGWVAHLTGVLVALHLVAITLMAFPAPGEGMARDAWKDPTAQAEFAVWRARLKAIGVDLSPDEFESLLWDIAVSYMTTRERLLSPFQPYYTYCGTQQSWRMFAGPHRHPARLHIEVREGDEWRTVYVQRDPERRWLAAWLDQYRFRPVLYRFGWGQGYGEYDHFAEWIARQAGLDFPEADAVRVRYFKYRTLSPDEVRAGRQPDGHFDPALDREARLR